MLALLFPRQPQKCDSEHHGSDGYAGISGIKCRPEPRIQKVRDYSESQPIDEITNRTAQYKPECDQVPDCYQVRETPVYPERQSQHQDDAAAGNEDERPILALENAKGSAGILYMDYLDEPSLPDYLPLRIHSYPRLCNPVNCDEENDGDEGDEAAPVIEEIT